MPKTAFLSYLEVNCDGGTHGLNLAAILAGAPITATADGGVPGPVGRVKRIYKNISNCWVECSIGLPAHWRVSHASCRGALDAAARAADWEEGALASTGEQKSMRDSDHADA